jgi:hypothetical protein
MQMLSPISSFFNWEAYLFEIELANENNKAFNIQIPQKEFERLEQEKIKSLGPPFLSKDAFNRLVLFQEEGRYYLAITKYAVWPPVNQIEFK